MRHLDIEAIRARCDAATRGPWTVVALTCPNGDAIVDSITGTGEPQWCDYGEGEGEWFTDSLVLVETDMGVYGPTMPDAQFIANARADVPALLAHIEELEQELAENDRLRDALAKRARVYRVEWQGITAFIRAVSRDKAKMRAMRSAREGGYWKPGQSLSGLRCTVASYVPPDEPVIESRGAR